jgi:hypothetical protein
MVETDNNWFGVRHMKLMKQVPDEFPLGTRISR